MNLKKYLEMREAKQKEMKSLLETAKPKREHSLLMSSQSLMLLRVRSVISTRPSLH